LNRKDTAKKKAKQSQQTNLPRQGLPATGSTSCSKNLGQQMHAPAVPKTLILYETTISSRFARARDDSRATAKHHASSIAQAYVPQDGVTKGTVCLNTHRYTSAARVHMYRMRLVLAPVLQKGYNSMRQGSFGIVFQQVWVHDGDIQQCGNKRWSELHHMVGSCTLTGSCCNTSGS
jgi:hypothetical protein